MKCNDGFPSPRHGFFNLYSVTLMFIVIHIHILFLYDLGKYCYREKFEDTKGGMGHIMSE
jgi:hypothetical protein